MSSGRTADQSLVRELNLATLLRALWEHAPVSRARLAALTGLNRATVSSLVYQMIEAGLVYETGEQTTQHLGRPGVLLEPNPNAGMLIGVEVGVDSLTVLGADFTARLLWRRVQPYNLGIRPHEVVRHATELIHAAIGGADCDILGISVAVPGTVDESTGDVLYAANLGWQDVPLAQMLRQHFVCPIHVGNGTGLAALGESVLGTARNAHNTLFVNADVGIGGGIILDGQLLPGGKGFAAARAGHMTMVPNGVVCSCGNRGCWETVAGQRAVFRYVQEAIDSGKRSSLATIDATNWSMSDIVAAARAGDEVARHALRTAGEYLGLGIANLVLVLGTERVVLGGSLSTASDVILPVIEEVLTKRAYHWSFPSVQLDVATYGADASAMGAVAAVLVDILRHPASHIQRRHDTSFADLSVAPAGRNHTSSAETRAPYGNDRESLTKPERRDDPGVIG